LFNAAHCAIGSARLSVTKAAPIKTAVRRTPHAEL